MGRLLSLELRGKFPLTIRKSTDRRSLQRNGSNGSHTMKTLWPMYSECYAMVYYVDRGDELAKSYRAR